MNQVKRLQAALYQIEKHPAYPHPYARALEMRAMATEALKPKPQQ